MRQSQVEYLGPISGRKEPEGQVGVLAPGEKAAPETAEAPIQHGREQRRAAGGAERATSRRGWPVDEESDRADVNADDVPAGGPQTHRHWAVASSRQRPNP